MTGHHAHQNSNSSTILSNKKEKEVAKHKVHAVLVILRYFCNIFEKFSAVLPFIISHDWSFHGFLDLRVVLNAVFDVDVDSMSKSGKPISFDGVICC